MADTTVTLRRADEAALEDIEALLAKNDLPSADVRTSPGRFYVGYGEDARIGIGGIERYGSDGLLRSVLVAESARGAGFGTALCDALERRARTDGVERLYLLTTTAAGFFANRGYEELERAAAPAAIRETTQFEEHCPASAVCMRKVLSDRS